MQLAQGWQIATRHIALGIPMTDWKIIAFGSIGALLGFNYSRLEIVARRERRHSDTMTEPNLA
jgi:hypothetical protein